MPKLARNYELKQHQYYHNTTVYDYNRYKDYRLEHNRIHKQPQTKRKFNPLRFIVSLVTIFTLILAVLPFAFKNITIGIFKPTPYKTIKTDMYSLAFPTTNYLSNNWFLGKRGFNISVSGKKAQMSPLKENVNMPLLEQKIKDLEQLYPDVHPSVFVWDYETGNYIDINADENFATASIIKLPVLIDLFKKIEAGQISLDDKMVLTEYYRTEGSGSLQFKAQNSQYTIDQLARIMITESDNSSTNMLVAKLGSMTNINSSVRNWGLKNTYMQNWLPDLKGTNRTSAKELATMLYNIDENDKFLSLNSRQKIFDYMGHVHNNRLIQAGLGNGSIFLHKTGDIGTMLGDAGIVIAPNGKKYITVILANRPHNAISGKDYIVKASEIIYNYMVK